VAHCVLQGKGQVRQRSLPADLIFSFFFIKKKELALAAMSVTKRYAERVYAAVITSGICPIATLSLAMTIKCVNPATRLH
jgi:hypothetical protein